MIKTVKLINNREHNLNKSVIVPIDGRVNIDENGEAEVSVHCARQLIGLSAWNLVDESIDLEEMVEEQESAEKAPETTETVTDVDILEGMSRSELKKFISAQSIGKKALGENEGVIVYKNTTDEEIREAIRAKMAKLEKEIPMVKNKAPEAAKIASNVDGEKRKVIINLINKALEKGILRHNHNKDTNTEWYLYEDRNVAQTQEQLIGLLNDDTDMFEEVAYKTGVVIGAKEIDKASSKKQSDSTVVDEEGNEKQITAAETEVREQFKKSIKKMSLEDMKELAVEAKLSSDDIEKFSKNDEVMRNYITWKLPLDVISQ